MYEKGLVLQVFSKSRSVFVKNHGFKQNCDFHGWERGGKGELIAPELDPGRSRIDVQLEELPVWKMCPFQLNGICFKENRS